MNDDSSDDGSLETSAPTPGAAPAAPRAPSGAGTPQLRTVALCDLADSTALVERLGDRRAAELFRRHDRLARDLLHRHQGREIDKTDGFLALFERPVQAVAFALDYQRALRDLGAEERLTLTARVGIHVGDVVLWRNADEDVAHGAKQVEVEGLAKPVAARLMQLARPGQILLSGMAQNLAHRSQAELGMLATRVRWQTHGRYRFKGVPSPMLVHEVGEVDIAPLRPPPSSSKAQRELPVWRRPRTLLVEATLALAGIAALAIALTTRPTPAIAFGERDWVVVGDLRNLTGDPGVEEALATAFRISLEQSRFVNVLSELQLRRTLARMHRDPDVRIDREVGSEIALREGVRALILPTVADIGGRMRVSAEVVDPHTQTTVYAHSADGDGMDSALAAVDRVATEMRDRLGEALRDIENDSSPLPDVSTGNLEALRAYAQAQRQMFQGQLSGALDLYREASRLDPEFALAHLGGAKIHIGSDDLIAARSALQDAAAHRERLAAREKLVLEAFEHTLGPPAPLLEKWKLIGSLYPDYHPAFYNYALFAWQHTNAYQAALDYAPQGVSQHNAALGPLHYLMGTLLLGTEQYEASRRHFEQARALDGAGLGLVWIEWHIAQRQHDDAETLLRATRVTGVAGKDIGRHLAAVSLAVDRGDWRTARAALAAAADDPGANLAPVADLLATHALVLASQDSSVAQSTMQLREAATARLAALHEADPVLQPTLAWPVLLTGYLAVRRGMTDVASAMLEGSSEVVDAAAAKPLSDMQELVRAAIDRHAGRASDAVQRLMRRIDGTEPLLLHVELAAAQADAGDFDAALTTLHAVHSRRGRAVTEVLGQNALRTINLIESNLALLTRAELLAATGQSAAAREALKQFEQAWAEPRPVAAQERIVSLRAALDQERAR